MALGLVVQSILLPKPYVLVRTFPISQAKPEKWLPVLEPLFAVLGDLPFAPLRTDLLAEQVGFYGWVVESNEVCDSK